MKSLMQQALGDAWDQLPHSLQAHYLPGATLDIGHLDVEYPAFMQPVLFVLSHLGALVRRRARAVQTRVEKSMVGQQLHYRGVRFVARVGCRTLHIPEWLALGHTTIVERAIDEHHFAMDFRLVHPVFGQVFRYSGTFRANASANTGIAAS
jgi:hypothetical protein